jgi:site-specific DNA-methyltransferase (adenine-specific)
MLRVKANQSKEHDMPAIATASSSVRRPPARATSPRSARASKLGSTEGARVRSPRGEAKIAPQLRSLIVPIETVTLHPNNPRRGDVDAVAASLARFGQQKPIVVQASTRYIVAGNHLAMAARCLGWSEIAANIEELDDATAVAFMIADNRTADLGGYDDALLAAILAEQQAAANLAATGYNADDVAAILAAAQIAETRDADAAPPVPERADLYVAPGDLWALGRHRLLCGDATDPAAVARLVGADMVDLLWSDPPYSVAYSGKTAAALTITNDDLGIEGTRALVAAALRLVPIRAGGAFYIASPAGPAHLAFLLALADAGLSLHQTLIWVKDRFVLGHSDYHYRHEPILYGWREGSHTFRGDRTQDSVWEIARPARNETHPTMKPVELVERAIRNSCAPGDTVSDPFVGSGTTIIAAERSDRRCLAMEIYPRYAQVAIERWQSFTGARATRLGRLGEPTSSASAQTEPVGARS